MTGMQTANSTSAAPRLEFWHLHRGFFTDDTIINLLAYAEMGLLLFVDRSRFRSKLLCESTIQVVR